MNSIREVAFERRARRWLALGPALALGLAGCTNSLDQAEAQQEDFVRIACHCDWMSSYASESECVSTELADLDPVGACEREAYGQIASIQTYIDCLVGANADYIDCLNRASCDDAAGMACNETRMTATDACPTPPEADLARSDEIIRNCRSGGPGTCPDGTATGSGMLGSGTTVGAGADLVGSCGGDNAPDVAFQWTAPTAGAWTFDTYGSDFDTVLYVLTDCAGTELACNDDGSMGFQSELTVELTAGQSVVIVVDGFGTDGGNFVLNATAP